MWRKIRDTIQMIILTASMMGGFFLGYLYVWAWCGLPMLRWALIPTALLAGASEVGWLFWVKYSKR